MKQLSEVLPAILANAENTTSNQSTLSHGLTREDGKTSLQTFAPKPLTPELLEKLDCKMRLIWQAESWRQGIKTRKWDHLSTDELTEYRKLMPWIVTPITPEIAAQQATMMLAAFPARDLARDAFFIADLSEDLVWEKCSALSIAEIRREIRQEGTYGAPFLPPLGVILKRCKSRTETYLSIAKYLFKSQ